MLQSLFEHDNDKESIKHCLQQCQTMALLAALPKDGKKNNSKSGKSIFSWGTDITCIYAIVYYLGSGNFTHILW